jgi:hypothetical protein
MRLPPRRVFIYTKRVVVFLHPADSRCLLPGRMPARGSKHGVGVFGTYDREELPLVGDVARVRSEELAGALELGLHGAGNFVEEHAHAGLPCNL